MHAALFGFMEKQGRKKSFLMQSCTISFRTVERLEFPRLTGATVDLRNLPEVTVVEVESQLFDKRLPCDLITGNLKTVTVAIVEGGGQPIQCVSVNDLEPC